MPCLALLAIPSKVGCSPPHVKSHLLLSCANLDQAVPTYAVRSSGHLRFCLPLLLFPVLGFPVSKSFGPSVVISPGYMPCPSPFGFFNFLNDIFDFGFYFLFRNFWLNHAVWYLAFFFPLHAVLSSVSAQGILLLSKFHSHMSLWVIHTCWKLSSESEVVFCHKGYLYICQSSSSQLLFG